MGVYKAKTELRRMDRGELFKLALGQGISTCSIGGGTCRFYLHYGGFNFCLSEILGQGCQVEKVEILDNCPKDRQEVNCSLPFMEKPNGDKKGLRYRVYYRDPDTRSMILLGTVTERRTKERGNNLQDLLVKALKDYANCVSDPSTVFLLG